MNAAEKGCEAPFDSIAADMFASGIQSVSANGVLGDQRPADAARGAYYLDKLAEYLVHDLKKEMGQIKGRGDK